jgi:hypothetical protein
MSANDLKAPDKKALREFGLVMAGAIAGIFGLLLPFLFEHARPIWPWPVALVFLLLGVFLPQGLRQIYVQWMRFGILIGRVTTPLLLGVIFYLIITPAGLIRRAVGGNSVRKPRDAMKDTYRVKSRQPDNEKMERPF